jgi:hypothetical protein
MAVPLATDIPHQKLEKLDNLRAGGGRSGYAEIGEPNRTSVDRWRK